MVNKVARLTITPILTSLRSVYFVFASVLRLLRRCVKSLSFGGFPRGLGAAQQNAANERAPQGLWFKTMRWRCSVSVATLYLHSRTWSARAVWTRRARAVEYWDACAKHACAVAPCGGTHTQTGVCHSERAPSAHRPRSFFFLKKEADVYFPSPTILFEDHSKHLSRVSTYCYKRSCGWCAVSHVCENASPAVCIHGAVYGGLGGCGASPSGVTLDDRFRLWVP